MNTKKNKFKWCIAHRRAIMHMIGQSQMIFNSPVSVADVAQWMRVTKQTARKHLEEMVADRDLVKFVRPYKNTVIHYYGLSSNTQSYFLSGHFRLDYFEYAQKVMGVVLQDEEVLPLKHQDDDDYLRCPDCGRLQCVCDGESVSWR